MAQVLSIQSNVVVGHVGNAAARPALERLGHRVWTIDTAILAHHPGHGAFTGEIRPPQALQPLVEGVAAVGGFGRLDAVLSGYLGDPGNASVVADAAARAKASAPGALYVCDPVIGDFDAAGAGRSFVRQGVAEAIRSRLIPIADILLPNRFELGTLTGMSIDDVDAVAAAARSLGVPISVVTSVDCADVPTDRIDVLVVTKNGASRASAPRLPRRFDGSGDLFAGLFLGAYLTSRDPLKAAEEALALLLPVLTGTGSAKDLDLSGLY
jgi:pyridoxine kinase